MNADSDIRINILTARFWNFAGGPPADPDDPSSWGPASCSIDASGQSDFLDVAGDAGIYDFQETLSSTITLESIDIGDVGAQP